MRPCSARQRLRSPDAETPPIFILMNGYGGVMKALHLSICLLIAFGGSRAFASEPAADADPWSGVAGLLAQDHRHSRASSPPMSLADLEAAAVANNPEIRVAMHRLVIAETRVR